MRYVGYLIILLLLILGVSFAILNAEAVQINYYVATRHMPLSLLMVICFGIGVLLGLAVLFLKVVRLRIDNRLLRRQLNKLKQEIAAIRALTKESINE